MRRILLSLSLLAGLAFAGGLEAAPAKAKFKVKGNFSIAGWLVMWDAKAFNTYMTNAADIDAVYPEWYTIGTDGLPRSNELEYSLGKDRDDYFAKKRKIVEVARKNGTQVLSMIVNFDNTVMSHSTARVKKFLYDPALRKKHIEMLVANAVKDGADGIDIDYENMKAEDAQPFCQFMAELRKACDAKGLLLAAALAPKFDPDGTWDGNKAHDYACLAPSLDLIRPMTYDEHWGTSTAGPVSSPEFSEMVDRYAVSVAGPGKVEIGIAAYGYDWKGKVGETIDWNTLQERVKKHKIQIKRDEETAELTGRYQDEKGDWREIWFCDAGSYRPKYELIKKYKLAGMAIWRFGSEDPSFWTDVKQFKYAKDWKK